MHVCAVEDDWDVTDLKSFGRHDQAGVRSLPNLIAPAWFDVEEARTKIWKGQAVFIDRLLVTIAEG